MVRDVLEARGYEVLTANTGEHGLELAFTEHPHLILLDVMMPGMDGYQVCRELQFGYTKDIPIVFLTAKTQLASMMEANRSGACAFITKPFRVGAPRADRARRAARRLGVLRRDHRPADPGASPGRGAARCCRPPSARHHLREPRRVFGLEQLQGFEVVDEVFRIVGQKLVDARGAFLREEDFISISSLGNAFLIILCAVARAEGRRRAGHAADQGAPRDQPDRPPRGRARGDAARQGRPLRGLRTARPVAQGALQARPAAGHRQTPPAASRSSATRSATASSTSSTA